MAEAIKIDLRMGDVSSLQRAVTSVVAGAQRAATNEARKSATARVAAEQSASQQIAREQLNAAKATAAAATAAHRSALAAQKAAAKEGAAAQKAAAREVANAQRAAAREAATFQREMDRAGAANFKARLREQDKVARESARAQARVERATSGRLGDDVGRSAVSGAGMGARRALGVLGAGTALVGGAVGTAGIIDAVQTEARLQKSAAQLASDVHEPGKAFLSSADLAKQAQVVAKQTGVGSEDVMAAMSEAAGSGGGLAGLEVFKANLEEIGTLSVATGSRMEDWARMSAEMTNNGVTDARKQMELMRAATMAGKTGNINARDMAAGIGQVMGAAQSGQFAGSGEERTRQASAFIQLSRAGGAKNAEDATTAARNFYNDIAKNEVHFGKGTKQKKGMGVTTIDESGMRVDAVEQFKQIMDKTGGDIRKVDPEFGMQSQSLFGKLMSTWKAGEAAQKGGGGAAIDDLMKQFQGANMSKQQVDEEADKIKLTGAFKFAAAMEEFKAEVGSKLLPAVTAAVPQFIALGSAVGTAVGFIVESPKTALAAFVGLNMAVGAAQGALGKLAGNLLEKLMPSATAVMNVSAGTVNMAGGPGVSPGGIAKGAPGLGLGAVAVAGVGAAILGAGLVAGVDDVAARDKGNADKENEARVLAANLRAGKGDAADKARLAQLGGELEADKGIGGFMRRAGSGLMAGANDLGITGDKKFMEGAGFNLKTAGDLASLIPTVAAGRAAVGAIGGTDTAKAMAGGGAAADNRDAALADINRTLAGPLKLQDGVKVAVDGLPEAMAGIAAGLESLAASNNNGPKAQPPPR